MHAPQHSNMGLRATATSLGDCLPLIMTLFVFAKSSSVFICLSNPGFKNSSVNQVQVQPQFSALKNLTNLWQWVPNAAVLLLPLLLVFHLVIKAKQGKASQVLNSFNNVMNPTSNKSLLCQ